MIFTGAMIGFFMSDRLKLQVEFFEELCTLISQLKIKIRFSSDTLLQLLYDTADLPLLKEQISSSIEYMEHGESFAYAWNAASDKTGTMYKLDKDDVQIIKRLGQGMGVSDTQGQLSHLELYSQLMEDRLLKARENARTKTKMYRLLGFLGGLACAVLLA